MNTYEVTVSKSKRGYNARCDALDIAVIDQKSRKAAIDAIRDNIAIIKPHIDAGDFVVEPDDDDYEEDPEDFDGDWQKVCRPLSFLPLL